jgi:hypothetical protein
VCARAHQLTRGRLYAKERELAECAVTNVVYLDDAQTARALRDNLARFRELLRSRHTPKVRQVLETRLGPLFNSHGAQERT